MKKPGGKTRVGFEALRYQLFLRTPQHTPASHRCPLLSAPGSSAESRREPHPPRYYQSPQTPSPASHAHKLCRGKPPDSRQSAPASSSSRSSNTVLRSRYFVAHQRLIEAEATRFLPLGSLRFFGRNAARTGRTSKRTPSASCKYATIPNSLLAVGFPFGPNIW